MSPDEILLIFAYLLHAPRLCRDLIIDTYLDPGWVF